MKKIPTLFKREFKDHRVCSISPEVTPGFEWVIKGDGIATVKYDGSCCAIINGLFYKRYDAKKGKRPPYGAIPCQPEPDPITGHWPHWVIVDTASKEDKWFRDAYDYTIHSADYPLTDGTYEAIGKMFQGNPYHMGINLMLRHGDDIIDNCPRSFEGIREYLFHRKIEGIVFWKDNKPQCKIKRSDFGYSWPLDNDI